MANRELYLTKDGHTYVFRFSGGSGERILDEISRLASDVAVNLDWSDAAALGFQIARNTAVECCTAMMSPGKVQASPRNSSGSPHEAGSGGDDAKDGPWTNTNYPS